MSEVVVEKYVVRLAREERARLEEEDRASIVI
jgi:hypothetical protein